MCAECVTHETVKECNKSSFLSLYGIIYAMQNVKGTNSYKSGAKILTDESRKVAVFDIRQGTVACKINGKHGKSCY